MWWGLSLAIALFQPAGREPQHVCERGPARADGGVDKVREEQAYGSRERGGPWDLFNTPPVGVPVREAQPGSGRRSLRARPHGPPGRTGGADGAPHGCVRTVADGFVGRAAVLEPRRPEQLLTHDVADVLGVGA